MNTELRAEKVAQAKVIWDQISRGTKMACGARDARADVDGTRPYLYFRVTIRAGVRHTIQVWLEPSDTYTVKLLGQRKFDVKEEESADDVYCDNLSDVIYRMCNK
jgi:hypothetical protein